jgi:hypothetical protein
VKNVHLVLCLLFHKEQSVHSLVIRFESTGSTLVARVVSIGCVAL